MATSQPKADRYQPHRWAVAVACATFPLIWVGGLVTTYDAGMAVPDWPSTFGYNLFLYPWTTWFFGPWDLFIEHGHRLLGALVGVLTIGLLVSVLRQESRRWVKRLGVVALALVVFQGCLGGARVLLNDRVLALIHGCVGPLFFAFACAMTVFTSSRWRTGNIDEATAVSERSNSQLLRVRRLAILTSILVYAQLVIGAHVRHVLPGTLPATFRVLFVFHLLMAGVVVVHVGLLAWASRYRQFSGTLRRSVFGLLALLLLQMVLGPCSWVLKYGWPWGLSEYSLFAGYTVQAHSMLHAMTVTAHVATGSLLLALSVIVVLRTIQPTSQPMVLRKSSLVANQLTGLMLFRGFSRWGQVAS